MGKRDAGREVQGPLIMITFLLTNLLVVIVAHGLANMETEMETGSFFLSLAITSEITFIVALVIFVVKLFY